jgi:hypothetical protein
MMPMQCALIARGAIKCWGFNSEWVLGGPQRKQAAGFFENGNVLENAAKARRLRQLGGGRQHAAADGQRPPSMRSAPWVINFTSPFPCARPCRRWPARHRHIHSQPHPGGRERHMDAVWRGVPRRRRFPHLCRARITRPGLLLGVRHPWCPPAPWPPLRKLCCCRADPPHCSMGLTAASLPAMHYPQDQ